MFCATKYFHRNLYCLINLTPRLFATKFSGVCYDTSHTSGQLTSDCSENVGKDTWVYFLLENSYEEVFKMSPIYVVAHICVWVCVFVYLCICVSYTGEERREEEDTWILYTADKYTLMNCLSFVRKICSTCNTCSSIYNIKV